MFRTVYKIRKMDCPSEEHVIRMKLDGLRYIKNLEFNFELRELTVYHEGKPDEITSSLNDLEFGSQFLSSDETTQSGDRPDERGERVLLWQVLIINLFFFCLEIIAGIFGNSLGLIADSLDMLADAFVYGLALFAVGGALLLKKRVARVSGYFQLFLALVGLSEVIRRFAGFEQMPVFSLMIIVSLLALAGNAVSLCLLQKSKSREAHLQASMIFTSNDVIVNLGVILAGVLVYITNSRYPDLIVGVVVFIIVAKGAFKILKLSK